MPIGSLDINRLFCVAVFFPQAQLQSDKQRGKKAASPSQRAARFGSQAHINTELMLVRGVAG
jgi:hypothetical protein